jgi:hypothetical protein
MNSDAPKHDRKSSPPLPAIESSLAPEAVMGELRTLSERGRLAGFAGRDDRTFECDAFGAPFDRTLVGTLTPGPGDVGTMVSFTSVLKRRLPCVFAIVLITTVWPGVWLTDRMLNLYFSWYDFRTWMWYIPLTVLPLPWAWVKMIGRSNTAAHASSLETIEKLRKALGARGG